MRFTDTVCSKDKEDSSSDSSYEAADSSDKSDEEELRIRDKDIDACVSNMKVKHLLPIAEIAEIFCKQVTCKRCALKNHKKLFKSFIDFCSTYKEKVERKEARKFFWSRTD